MNPQIVDIFNFDEKTLADTNSWEISLFHQCLGICFYANRYIVPK